MPVQTIGDMSQQFQSMRQTARIKSDLLILSNELATQQKSDITASLGGNTARLESLDREINLLDSYVGNTAEIRQRLSFMQSTLEAVDQVRANFMDQSLTITRESNQSAILNAASAGRDTFQDIVGNLNKRWGDRALFGGAATDQDPLADANVLLADITSATAGLTTATDIQAAVSDWFDNPTGGFATIGYIGDAGPAVEQRIGPNTHLEIASRADNDATKELLKGAALAAMADRENPTLTSPVRAELVKAAGEAMLAGADGLAQMRGSLGANEARAAEMEVTQTTQLTAYRLNRNDLTVADPFDTASRLQSVQQQLEMHYTVTARLSRLSLVNYLR